jgi:hypothetical protein
LELLELVGCDFAWLSVRPVSKALRRDMLVQGTGSGGAYEREKKRDGENVLVVVVCCG